MSCDNALEKKTPKDQLLDLYTRLAKEPESDFGWGKGKENARALGYREMWLDSLPDRVWESAAAVGNPFDLGPILPGETVIDLGCGAGADACVAGLLVGSSGSVHGIDCTPAMIVKAQANSAGAGLEQVEFHLADISTIPLDNACADVLISNGAINLAQDKEAVLQEVFRLLRPGGRLQVADMVRTSGSEHLSCCSEESWADCVSGTLRAEEFVSSLNAAGFQKVALVAFTGYKTADSTEGALFKAEKPE